MLKGLVSYGSSDSDSERESDAVIETPASKSEDRTLAKKTTKINLLDERSIPELQITRKKFSNDSAAKSGLLSVLPPAHNAPDSNLGVARLSSTKKTSLMPTAILKRKNLSDLNDEIESDALESETSTNYFSFLEKGRTSVAATAATTSAVPKLLRGHCDSTSTGFEPETPSSSKSNAYFSSLVNSASPAVAGSRPDDEIRPADDDDDETMLEKMPLDFRGANGSVSALDIIDVNADEITKENRLLMLRNLTDETTCVGGLSDIGSGSKKRLKSDGSTAKGGGAGDVGSLHRKKHQITYLAQQAIENETQLKNFWAANRHAQDQSRQKYGF